MSMLLRRHRRYEEEAAAAALAVEASHAVTEPVEEKPEEIEEAE